MSICLFEDDRHCSCISQFPRLPKMIEEASVMIKNNRGWKTMEMIHLLKVRGNVDDIISLYPGMKCTIFRQMIHHYKYRIITLLSLRQTQHNVQARISPWLSWNWQ